MRFLPLLILLIVGCTKYQDSQNESDFSIADFDYSTDDIEKFELYFSEFGDRMQNASCDVVIKDDEIIVLQNEKTNLTGGQVLAKGTLRKHKSGKWIIAESEQDIYADEIGGCSGGPIVIDIENKIVEWC